MEVLCPYLVGREVEVAALRERLTAARAGTGRVVFVSGEPGVGKSRLVRELVEVAGAAGVPVLVGRAVPGPGQVAYRPIAEVLLRALRGRSVPDDPALVPWLAALRAVVPAFGSGALADENSAPTLGEAVIRVLRRVVDGRPLVLVFEDLHWADPDTLAVLEYVADNLTGEATLCLCTLRAEPSSGAWSLAQRVGQRGAGTHLRLGPLGGDAVAEMVRACQPEAGEDLVARVRATADGLPLVVEELLATPGIPATVEEAVRARVAVLGDNDRSVLSAAAVLGREFDWRLLAQVTGLGAEAVVVALERMVATLLVSIDGDEFRFRHALTREAVVASLLPPRRAALARAALAALDHAHPDHHRADLALQAGDQPRAGALLATSGRASLAAGALATAAQALRRAGDLLDDPAARADTQVALVRALALAGRVDEALTAGEELLVRLGGNEAAAPAVHVELARAAASATRWPTAVTHLDAARGLLSARPDALLSADIDTLRAEVALAAGDVTGARTSARQALDVAEAMDAPEIACHALELLGRGHRVHDLALAQAAFARAYALADKAELPVWRLRALHELGTIELLDHAGTGQLLAARQAAEQLGALSTVVVLDIQLASAYHLHFDLPAAIAAARRAIALSGRLGLGRSHAVAQFFDAAACALRGDRPGMREALALAARAIPDDTEIEGVSWAGGTAMYELLWGERAAALGALDRGMAALATVPHSAPGPYRGLWALLSAVEHRADAAENIQRVRESGATVMRANRGFLHYAEAVLAGTAGSGGTVGSGSTAAALAAVAAGDRDLAYVPFWQHIGRVQVAEAALADGWGTPRSWLTEARACLDQSGLLHLARRCASLLGVPAGWSPNGVTAREAEILTLVAAGLANKEIAARLHLSARTVEKHVESLLRKAGARSRTRLAAMVREPTAGETT